MLSEDELLELIEGLDRRDLTRWVRQGWVRPQTTGARLTYAEIDIARVRLIHEMRHDLSVNEEGIPLLLSLLDQVYSLRRELRRLGAAVDAQPDAVRQAILDYMKHAGED